MIKRIVKSLSIVLIVCSVAVAQLPGEKDGRMLLPNGWWLSPAGTSIDVGDLPLNAALSPDQRYMVVTHGGMSKPVLMLVDLKEHKVVQTVPVKDSWLGIVFHGKTLYVSGGNQNCVYTFNLEDGKLTAGRTIQFAPPRISGYPPKGAYAWAAGLDVNKNYLAVVFRGDSTLRYYNLKSKKIEKVRLDGMPYYCKYLSDGTLLVSMWSSKRIEAFRGKRLIYRVATGDHPTEIAVRGRYAFVANANDNSVSVIDLKT